MDRASTTFEFSLSKQNGTIIDSSKISSNSQNINDSLNSDYSARANKADEMFKNLIERVNKSKEYVESVHRSTFSSNNSEPTKDTPTLIKADEYKKIQPETFSKYLPTNVKHSSEKSLGLETLHRAPLIDKNTTKKSNSTNILGETNDLSDDYGRLSHELHEFKENLLEKVRKNKPKEEIATVNPKLQVNSSRLKKFDLISSEEEQQEEEDQPIYAVSSKKSAAKAMGKSSVKNSSVKTSKSTQSPTKSEISSTSNTKTIKCKKSDPLNNINQLKNALNGRENLLQEKYVNLKFRSKELRNTLQEYVNKCLDLEDTTKLKDQQLQDFQNQLRQTQIELAEKTGVINEFTKKEEVWIRTEKELQAENKALEESQFQLTKKLKDLELMAKANEQQLLSQIQTIQNKKQESKDDNLAKDQIIFEQKGTIQELEAQFQIIKKENGLKDSRFSELESANAAKVQECQKLKEQIEDLERISRGYLSTIEELKESKNQSQEKISKLKKKMEDERIKFQEEKQLSLKSKKEKIKKLRTDLKQSETFTQKLLDEKKVLEFEIEKQRSSNAALIKDLKDSKDEVAGLQQELKVLDVANDNLKKQNDEISKNYNIEIEKALQLKSELKKATKQLKKLEEKLGLKEKDSIKVDEITDRMKSEVKLLLEENANAREYIARLESSLNSLRSKQENEKEKVGVVIDGLEEQLQKAREENALLKSKETHICKELEETQEERDHYKKEYKTMKQVNKTIEKDYRAIDQKIKVFIAERDQQLQEQSEKQSSLKNQSNSKLQTLDEIQNLIKSHRLAFKSNSENIDLNRGQIN